MVLRTLTRRKYFCMKQLLSLFFLCVLTTSVAPAPADIIDDEEMALEAEVDREMSEMNTKSWLTSFFMGAYNAYNWVIETACSAWETGTSFFSSLWDQTGHKIKKKIKRAVKGKKTHPLLEELKKSAPTREKKFFAAYTDSSIPNDLRKVASVIDRFEDDFKIIKRGIAPEKDAKAKKTLIKALHTIDNDVDDYIDQVQDLLMKYQRESFFKKDSTIFHFVNDLQSRAFVRAMSE